MQLGRVMLTWQDWTQGTTHKRRLGEKIIQRLKHNALFPAFASWMEQASLLRHRRQLVQKMCKRWQARKQLCWFMLWSDFTIVSLEIQGIAGDKEQVAALVHEKAGLEQKLEKSTAELTQIKAAFVARDVEALEVEALKSELSQYKARDTEVEALRAELTQGLAELMEMRNAVPEPVIITCACNARSTAV
jgi:hypothetical protein